jgi:hypothetical protein
VSEELDSEELESAEPVSAEASTALEILPKVVWSSVPRLFTTVMIAPAMHAAMRAYSMAVAPDPSFSKRETGSLTELAPRVRGGRDARRNEGVLDGRRARPVLLKARNGVFNGISSSGAGRAQHQQKGSDATARG